MAAVFRGARGAHAHRLLLDLGAMVVVSVRVLLVVTGVSVSVSMRIAVRVSMRIAVRVAVRMSVPIGAGLWLGRRAVRVRVTVVPRARVATTV